MPLWLVLLRDVEALVLVEVVLLLVVVVESDRTEAKADCSTAHIKIKNEHITYWNGILRILLFGFLNFGNCSSFLV